MENNIACEINDNIFKFDDALNNWIDKEKTEIKKLNDNHNNTMHKQSEELNLLKLNINRLNERAEQQKRDLELSLIALEDRKKQLISAKQQAELLPKTIQERKTIFKAIETEVKNKAKKMQQDADISEQRLLQLEHQMSIIEKILGLRIQSQNGTLQFELLYPTLKTSEGTKILSFSLYLDSNRIYKIFEGPNESEFPGFEQYVVELNNHQDLPYFIHSIRRRFVTYKSAYY